MANIWANENRDVAAALRALLQAYDAGGGSNAFSMHVLRQQFANHIPFTDENFHRHFSMFATEAVAMDLRANRFCYKIGGHPPDISIPIEDTEPYILPTQLFQQEEQVQPDGRRDGRSEQADNAEFRADEDGLSSRGGDERRRNKRKNQGDRDRESPSSSDSELSYRAKPRNNHVFSFTKKKKVLAVPLPQEAQDINKLIKEYRDNNIHDAVLDFCWESGKDPDFPDALVQDLLQYKFIDLEKINAGPNTQNFSITSKSKDSDPASKIKPKPFKEATEWRDAVHLLVETLCLAFDCAESSFRRYDNHLKIMERTFRERGDWRDVIPYDIALRKAFATRRHLSFADFAGDELAHLKHLALGDRKSHREVSHTTRSNPSTSTHTRNSSSSRNQGDKKPKMDHPWAGKVRNTKNLPRCEQLCGGWNLDKCSGEKCSSGRIHGMCDYVGCYESHKRISHLS
ncbi:hypothetical protein DFH28DRAFT_915102 [Melampsora americana]|nr:hypothetical protein DFH28DRAFT_915102 [Melampsora americana]